MFIRLNCFNSSDYKLWMSCAFYYGKSTCDSIIHNLWVLILNSLNDWSLGERMIKSKYQTQHISRWQTFICIFNLKQNISNVKRLKIAKSHSSNILVANNESHEMNNSGFERNFSNCLGWINKLMIQINPFQR